MTEPPVDRSRLLGRDYFVVHSIPTPGTTASDIERLLDEHLRWLLALERTGVVLLSGPLLSGPNVTPGSGLTVLRADDEAAASAIAAGDPFVVNGIRSFEIWQWRVNEGSVTVRVSLGTRSVDWF